MLYEVLSIISKPSVNSVGVTVQKCSIWVKIWQFFVQRDLEIWPMTFQTIWQLFCTGSSFVHHFVAIGLFKLELQSGNNAQFICKWAIFVPCDLGVWRWPWNTIGPLFYTTSSFVHHFVTIRQFKPELQSGNAEFGSKSAIFGPVWPWNLMNDIEQQ